MRVHKNRVGSQYRLAVCLVVVLAAVMASAAAWAAVTPSAPAAPDSREVLGFLKEVIAWHGRLSAEQRLPAEPNELGFLNEHRQIADRVLRLSLEFAKAEADFLAKTPGAAAQEQPEQVSGSPRLQTMRDRAARSEQRLKQAQQELESLKQRAESASGRKRQVLQSAITETQSEIELAQARRDVLRAMADFASGAANGTGDLRTQIEELERAIPAANASLAESASAGQNASRSPAAVMAADIRRTEGSGIIALASDWFALRRKLRVLDGTIEATDSLAQTSRDLRAPFVKTLKELSARGDELANQPQSADPAALAKQKSEIDALTAGFKQFSAVVLPLSKQSILLDLGKRNLTDWRAAVKTQYTADLRSLVLRLALLAVVLAFVVAFSKVWSRAIFRYVRDLRRQHQLLMLRRFVLWFVIVIVVAFAFATEIGSLATFAGLITAGVALALQGVIQSIVGYFFLIGRYGVRLGDRVQICGTTGEVVDIGLVRLHVMEVDGGRPTGRVVVFSNSVVFQPNAGFFKQIPGTSFVWHEVTLTLAADTDYRLVDERLVGAVQAIFAEYRENMEHQRRQIERALTPISVSSLAPQSRVRLTPAGLEVVIRYPVELANARDIDDRITRALLEAIEGEPQLRVIGPAAPHVQAVGNQYAASVPSAPVGV
jgi:small-conductance mechanosensitive channel